MDPTIGVIIAAVIGPVGAYFLAARKMSGKIATSEATQLWEESRSIREWSAQRIQECDRECASLRVALSDALTRIRNLEDQLEDAYAHIATLEGSTK